MNISISKKILTGFATALVALIATGVVSYRSTVSFLDTNRWVEHTRIVIQEIESTLVAVTSAESAVRGYVITGDANYLSPYETGMDEVNKDIERLQLLTADNPKQQSIIPVLKQHVSARMSLLKILVDTRERSGLASAQALVSSGTGKAELEATDSVIAEMSQEENRLLAIRSAKSEESASSAGITFLLLGLLDFVFLGTLYFLTRKDLVERKRVEDELEQERHLLHTLMDYLPDSIYFKDRESRFIRINQALATRLGLNSPAQAVGLTDLDFFSSEHFQTTYRDEQAIMHTGEPLVGKDDRETWIDGRVTWNRSTKMALLDSSGAITGTFGLSSDVTESKRIEKLLQDLATRDELTGLLNRREMGRILDIEIDRYTRYDRPVSLVLMDIDHFKNVNDLYGHPIGDAVLKWVAHVIEGSVRQLDYSTRFGGEEFAIILPETTQSNALTIAERVCRRISDQPFRISLEGKGTIEIKLTASLGVAEIGGKWGNSDTDGTGRTTLIAHADHALYEAKHRGRNCVVAAEIHADCNVVAV